MSQLDPVVNGSTLYINGLAISNNATTPNTKLDIAAGQCRDSNNVIDIVLGDFLNEGNPFLASSVTTLNTAVVGINGLDTGTLGASKVYGVYVIADSSNKNPTGVTLSLNQTTPALPFGYDSYRLIGYWTTSSGSVFLLGYVSGFGGSKLFTYDAPITVGTTAASATYADIDLTAFVPLVNNLPVSLAYKFSPNADGDSFELHGANSTGDAVTIWGPTAAKFVGANTIVLAQTKTAKPQISYKTAAAIGSLALLVAGYYFSL